MDNMQFYYDYSICIGIEFVFITLGCCNYGCQYQGNQLPRKNRLQNGPTECQILLICYSQIHLMMTA